MPPVFAGRRRLLMGYLVALGVLQAALALVLSLGVTQVLGGAGHSWSVPALIGTVLGLGVARWIERVVAEDLGQDYVHQQRRRLVAAALRPDHRASLGVTVTRASNDLTSVRNWLTLGIVPLLTGIPLLLVVLGALAWLDPRVLLAVALPLALVGLVVPGLARATFARSRALRRRRGRLSARIADVVLARESVVAAGAMSRELNAVARDSARVTGAAVDRAWVTGLTRASTMSAASLSTVAVVALAATGHLDAAGVAGTMTLLGVLAGPVTDAGRVVEYRQNYLAAARILAPLNKQAATFRAEERQREEAWTAVAETHGAVAVQDLVVDGDPVPDLEAFPGDRVLVRSAHPQRARAVLGALAYGQVSISGQDLTQAPAKGRRDLIGVAAGSVPLERGSISRLAGLRVPDATDLEIRRVLELVGLRASVTAADRGVRTTLKNDGRPWSSEEVTRLKLARAVLREPPLLVLSDLDDALGPEGRAMLADVVAHYPGVVFFHTPHPESMGHTIVWNLDTC